MDQIATDLKAKNEQLTKEIDHLKTMLSLMKEKTDLGDRTQACNSGSVDESTAQGAKSKCHFQRHLEEGQFRRDLQQPTSRQEQRTSSPTNFRSFLQTSAFRDTDESEVFPNFLNTSLDPSGPSRLLGEIAFQLDKRILMHIFQAQKRLYGFTLLNIREKIIEVSTHPVTGNVDKGYQLYLTQRYTTLMNRLSQLGYKAALHPLFSEFVVNTYGNLKERPNENSLHLVTPNSVKKVILSTAPKKLQKDLLLLLNCLCYMAEDDKKPLFFC
ncbi:speriolin-like protein [Oryzias melastigma]|uniref:Speriolin-like protein n=1 Tax=Oryzias melastigma TaxID=30732 RepID=A0A3B3CNZ7_ORYME|nr:speriolin-like protein [Oryzias melastigma]